MPNEQLLDRLNRASRTNQVGSSPRLPREAVSPAVTAGSGVDTSDRSLMDRRSRFSLGPPVSDRESLVSRARPASTSFGNAVERTFTTLGLPPALAELASSPGWLDARVASGRFEGLTVRQILQNEEIHLGRTSEVEDAAERSATPGPPLPSPAPGSSLICGPVPPSSLLLSPEGSLLLPSGRFSSILSAGCSTVLVSPSDRASLLSLDFLVVTETETEVIHSYVREKAWFVLLPDEELSIETADPEQRRRMGCGCATRAVECQGCGAVVGYGLFTNGSCDRHFGPAYAFDPARVRVVPPLSHSATSRKRKRSNTTPSSLSSRQPSPAAARDLRTGEVRQVTTSGSREGAGDVLGPYGGDIADETAVEASLTETRRVVGR